MNTIGLSERDINNEVGTFTKQEIWGQPRLWQAIYMQAVDEKKPVLSFLKNAISHKDLNIILTGAGSSAFIGLSLTGVFKRYSRRNTTAISTTDLVTHPADYLDPDTPLLLISFARSGNSPESVAAVRVADQICSKVYHLIITCDQSGELAQYKTNSSKYVFVLPAGANDKSLAMTGSYSGMLLAGLLIARINEIKELQSQVEIIREYGLKLLGQAQDFRQLAELNFERAVFLGSGPLYGTATESHLKVQELTDGKIICKKDSFLGFRHGPKAVVNNKTLVFMLFSNQSYVLKYETDLIDSLKNGQKPLFIAGLAESELTEINVDQVFVMSDNGNSLDEEFLPVCSILPAQMLGYYKCLQLGLDPDLPSASGAISRVVKGVIIYPYKKTE
jgi:tagatose-6-phosphate ketose/aldose isomerase